VVLVAMAPLVLQERLNDVTDVDQLARDTANEAIALIEKHESVCTERQGHIIENLRDLKRGVEGLYRRFWAAALGIITLLLGTLGALIHLIITRNGG
jgi:hypothetical protein